MMKSVRSIGRSCHSLWIGALLTLYTGYDYLRAALRHVTAEEE